MTDLNYRAFSPGDIPAITRIYAHYVLETVISFENDPPSETEMAARFAAILEKGHPLIIAERHAQVIGYAYASTFRPRIAYRFTCEDSIYLAPDAVGQGIGGALLSRLIESAAEAGLKQMVAVITAERANSIRLHEKQGFKYVGRHEAVGFKFDRWLDVVHLQRAL